MRGPRRPVEPLSVLILPGQAVEGNSVYWWRGEDYSRPPAFRPPGRRALRDLGRLVAGGMGHVFDGPLHDLALAQAFQQGQDAPAGDTLLFVNVPVFFSSYKEHPQGCQNPYPWTPVGAVIMPAYASARDFVRFNGAVDTLATAVTVGEYAPGWNTFGDPLDPAELRDRLRVETIYVYDLNDGDFFDLSAAWLPGGALMA